MLLSVLAGCESPSYTNSSDAFITLPDVNDSMITDVSELSNDTSFVKQTKILLIGDSQAGRCSTRVDRVKKLNQIVFVDYKVSTTIQYWNDKRFATTIERYSPDKIVIFLGTNNYLDKTLPNVESILSTIKNKSLDCVWLGPVAVRGDKNIAINKLLKRAVGETCVYVDSIDANIQLEDGIHPSSSGIDVWLNLAWDNFGKHN